MTKTRLSFLIAATLLLGAASFAPLNGAVAKTSDILGTTFQAPAYTATFKDQVNRATFAAATTTCTRVTDFLGDRQRAGTKFVTITGQPCTKTFGTVGALGSYQTPQLAAAGLVATQGKHKAFVN